MIRFGKSVALLLLLSLYPRGASAIPVFARRYRTACTTCHVIPPRLNSFGLAFRANGYRLPAGEERRGEEDVQLGAPEWEGLFPRAFLPGILPSSAPFAARVRLQVKAERDDGVSKQETQALLQLLSGGNLGKRVSWFASAGFIEGGNTFLGRAYLSVDRLAGRWLNARIGRVEPAAVPFSAYTHALSYEPYLPFAAGLLPMGTILPAVEIWGAGSDPGPARGLRYSAGVGARRAIGGLAPDGWGSLSYKFGGIAAAGDTTGSGPAIAPLEERSLRIGVFAMRNTLFGPPARLRALRAGGDVELQAGRTAAYGAAWLGSEAGETSWAFMAGGDVRLWPWLMLLGRYEAASTPGTRPVRQVVGTVQAALQQNAGLSIDVVVQVPDGERVESAASAWVAF